LKKYGYLPNSVDKKVYTRDDRIKRIT